MTQENFFITEYDQYLFRQGTHYRSYEKLGAHLGSYQGQEGARFAVWAPNAKRVSVAGDFNDYDAKRNSLICTGDSGIWEGFVPGVRNGDTYKYYIESKHHDYKGWKADPYAFFAEKPPLSASRVWNIFDYQWSDGDWMAGRSQRRWHREPMNTYEMHLGSWKRDENWQPLSYRRLAEELPRYLNEMGFTHVEFMPVTEHPFDGSWGYQTIGYFAPTSRFGTPQDFMYLVDELHRHGIAVILDWVPAHFPRDDHGLNYFDGTHLYEHADPRQGYHPDWGSNIFNFGRTEVANFLLSSALFWFEKYHIDGVRIDAVASMLYLDYSRRDGEWLPNQWGGKENIEAISFLRRLNELIYSHHPGAFTIAEESTSWSMVSRPTSYGGLGFGFKWNMGWMNDTLSYMSKEPVHRAYHHNQLTFSMLYAFHENFVLPLSHDEVVHGKGSLLQKMPGDDWQKFANLRCFLGYIYGHPGKKLLFMGSEIGEWDEWWNERQVHWENLQYPNHAGMQLWLKDLNHTLRNEPALYEVDHDWRGFEWIDCHDYQQSILSLLRWNEDRSSCVVVLCNFTPVVRHGYVLGVPWGGQWREILNSDSQYYWGSGVGNGGVIQANNWGAHGRPHSLTLTLPPLATIFLKPA